MPDSPDSGDGRTWWAFALGAGTELVVCVLAGFLAGQWLDRKFGKAPLFMLVGTFAGISLGLYQLIRSARNVRSSR